MDRKRDHRVHDPSPVPPSPRRDKTGDDGPEVRAACAGRSHRGNLPCFWIFPGGNCYVARLGILPRNCAHGPGDLSPAVVCRDTRRVLLCARKYPGRADHYQERSVPVRPPPFLHGGNYDLYRDRTCHPVVGSGTRPVAGVLHCVRIPDPCRGEGAGCEVRG